MGTLLPDRWRARPEFIGPRTSMDDTEGLWHRVECLEREIAAMLPEDQRELVLQTLESLGDVYSSISLNTSY